MEPLTVHACALKRPVRNASLAAVTAIDHAIAGRMPIRLMTHLGAGPDAEREGSDERERTMETSSGANRVLIGVAAVLGIAVVALAIWGFSTKSDLDDANAKISELDQGASTEQAQNVALKGFSTHEAARYRRARASLISADSQNSNFKKQVSQDSKALEQARHERASAQSADDKKAAQLKVAKARSNAAVSCAQATVNVVGAFDQKTRHANNAGRPAEVAMDRLSGLVGPCKRVLNGG